MKIHKIIGIIVVILILFLVVAQLSTMVSCEERVKETVAELPNTVSP